jgi:hypothetical protein
MDAENLYFVFENCGRGDLEQLIVQAGKLDQ